MLDSPEVIGIIPARYESTRFPGKPLAKLLDKSLIQWTYENALRCNILNELIVATDDARIYDHVKGFGGNVVMTSPTCANGSDRLAEVVRSNTRYQKTKIVVNFQGDEPLINPSMIKEGVETLINDSKAVMLTAAAPLPSEERHNIHTVKCVMDTKGYALYFSRALIPGSLKADQNKVCYFKHIGLYIYKKDFLLTYEKLPPTPLQLAEDLEQLKILEHGYSVKVLVVNYKSLDVNRPEDIQKVEKELCTQNTFL